MDGEASRQEAAKAWSDGQKAGIDIPKEVAWTWLSLNPAKRLGLACGRMAEGAPADLVLFDADKPLILDRFKLRSKSKNTPFDGARLQGKVLATFVAGTNVYRSA